MTTSVNIPVIIYTMLVCLAFYGVIAMISDYYNKKNNDNEYED